ncbi:MAG: 3,4-dihydroxy-2-butanone-4-phosphate synthase [Methanomassiliicoccus sp.]|nr:3,4-dihydroxy-2-butanone-4-phosphate synthase [Methanomassiliicoccus sp.]
MDKIGEAQAALKSGKFVLVFDSDSREAETDMMIASEHVTFESIRTLRKEAGGLICTTVPAEVSKKLDLPFLAELFVESYAKHPVLKGLAPNDLPYDTKSAFSLTINHRHTFTGIPDRDRALTISEFAKLGKQVLELDGEAARKEFGAAFRAPGHVFLLNSQPGVLNDRRGHTELVTALMKMGDMFPSATICEMMGEDGKAMRKEKAQEYARRYGVPYLEGAEIIEAWKKSVHSR